MAIDPGMMYQIPGRDLIKYQAVQQAAAGLMVTCSNVGGMLPIAVTDDGNYAALLELVPPPIQ